MIRLTREFLCVILFIFLLYKLDQQSLCLANLETLFSHDKQKRVKIIVRCSAYYSKIGHDLLNDTDGSKVKSLEQQFRDPEKILQEIFGRWLREHVGYSWEKLILCLKRCDLNSVAYDIEDALGIKVQTREGLFYVLRLYGNLYMYVIYIE